MKKISLTLSLLLLSFFAVAQFTLTVESGAVFNQYNNVQAPNADNNKGTRFSLTDDFTPKQPVIFFRAQASYLINDRHRIEVTAVPLTFEYDKNSNKQISFDGMSFDAGTASYQFNTYRASYRYRLVRRKKTNVEVGVTGLVRDAKIQLTQGSKTQKNTDLGAVPLVSFYVDHNFTPKFLVELSGDALVGPVGRAEDVFLGFRRKLVQDKLQLKAGYRIIEGGADVDQVYNFSLFHFATIGLTGTF